jgi:hypothetical protein
MPHRQCAWCGRLKHKSGQPHGPRFDPKLLARAGYSHGACLQCKIKLVA